MRLFALIACLVAAPALADELPLPMPALYDVTGVADDDVLNIRALPSSDAEIIGGIEPFETEVEVIAVSRNSEWGLVNAGEFSGWASLSFLTPSEVTTGAYGLPIGFSCFGTEPFWSLQITEAGLEVITPETIDAPDTYPIEAIYPDVQGPRDLTWGMLMLWSEDGEARQARVLPGQCSDGMSDRAYGLHFVDPVIGYGCCSLSN